MLHRRSSNRPRRAAGDASSSSCGSSASGWARRPGSVMSRINFAFAPVHRLIIWSTSLPSRKRKGLRRRSWLAFPVLFPTELESRPDRSAWLMLVASRQFHFDEEFQIDCLGSPKCAVFTGSAIVDYLNGDHIEIDFAAMPVLS